MVRIKPGDFWMGSPDTDRDADNSEKPRHEVTITRPFWLGKFEVTQGEFVDLMERNPSQFAPDGSHKKQLEDIDTRRLPVESVSWLDAVQFCNRLSAKHKLEPYYAIEKEAVKILGGAGYRLPTEAEWEYACRAGTETRWSFGADVRKLDDHAWHAGNSQRMPHPVGEKQANPWGLYDMHGNVPEWVWDRFDPDSYKKSMVSDPLGSGRGDTRVFRGGSWNDRALQTRSATRESLGMHYGVTSGVGFRVARDAEP
jgi:formylglycine-generating enzyme required for sulfatase activity